MEASRRQNIFSPLLAHLLHTTMFAVSGPASRPPALSSSDEEISAVGLDEAVAPAPDDPSAERRSRLNGSLEANIATADDTEQQHKHRNGKHFNGVSRSQNASPTTASDPAQQHEYSISHTATTIFMIGQLVLFSILGTLARLGLQGLTTYSQAPVAQGLVWANFAGSFVMGYLSEERTLFREEWGHKSSKPKPESSDPSAEKKRHSSVKKTIPLFIGLATGFCGSLTSFSSFQRDVFLNLANSVSYPDRSYPVSRSGGYSFLALLASLITTPCLSLAALSGGAHFALFTERYTPTLPFLTLRGLVDPLLTFLGFSAWLGAVLMSIFPPDRPGGPANTGNHGWERETWRGQAVFALVFAPLGALARFYISKVLNPRVAKFPLGTFTVNIGGTLLEALFFDLQHAPLGAGAVIGGGIVACQVLQGLQDGLCGGLTTVSTWVLELKTLKKGSAYVYGLASLLGGLAITVVVMGSLRWTIGFGEPVCVV